MTVKYLPPRQPYQPPGSRCGYRPRVGGKRCGAPATRTGDLGEGFGALRRQPLCESHATLLSVRLRARALGRRAEYDDAAPPE